MIISREASLVRIEMTRQEAAQLHAALQSNVNLGWVNHERGKLVCWGCLGVQGELAQSLSQAGVRACCSTETEQEVRSGS